MTNYNWDEIFRHAIDLVPRCTTPTDLARLLDIPSTTLRSAMARRGLTFPKLLAQSTYEQETGIKSLQLQNQALRKEIEYLNRKIGQKAWLRETLVEMSSVLKLAPVSSPPKAPQAETPQTAVLLLSDVHLGQETPVDLVQDFGEYNSKIAEARMRHVFTAFASVVKHQAFPISDVVVFGLGDWVEHAHLRPGHEGRVDLGVVKQTLQAADIGGHGLLMLAEQFPRVTFIGIPGNHGRVTSDPRKSSPTENFDYMCYRIMQMMLQDQPNIDWIIPESWYVRHNIQGWNFFAIHGEDIRSYAGFPWYGATRDARNYVGMFRLAQRRMIRRASPKTVEELQECMIVPDYALLAHFHTEATWESPDIEHFANGAMPGVSAYGAKRIKKINRSSQRMFFVHPKFGVTMRCPIDLDDIGI